MNKDVLFWVGVNSPHTYHQEKHGGFKYFQYSEFTWRYWCEKNDVIFFTYTYDLVGQPNTRLIPPTIQRWFDVFRVLDDANIQYNKIAVIDASTMIRWDAPNFFNECDVDKVTVFRSLENLRWIYEGVSGYSELFDNFKFDLTKYFSCGFQIFGKSHKSFLDKLKSFYDDNFSKIQYLQNEKVKRGTDQPVYNYLAQIENVNMSIDSLSKEYYITHLNRFDWLGHNWQLNSVVPHFIKYGFIWFFSGMVNRGDREDLMKQTWDLVKSNYKN